MRSRREVSLSTLRARKIIQDLQIIEPSDLSIEDIAWTQGVLVREEHLEGADGRLVIQGQKGIVAVKTSIPEIGRKRFVIAHELGHFEIHKNSKQIALCTDKDMLFWHKTHPEETEANEFAVEILMPEDLFKPKCEKAQEPSMNLIEDLSKEFQTTLTATALRYVEFTPERCALILSEDKKIKWFKTATDFGYWLEKGSKLDPNSYAYNFFSNEDIPPQPQIVPATAWLPDRRLGSSWIKENSKALPRYNTVLTLLWIYQDMEKGDVGSNATYKY
jgi:Zn-dependent peptidase ImmA (M78 family)